MPIERAQPLQGNLELRVISPKERMRATTEPQGTGRCIIDGLIPDFHLKWLVLRASPWRLQEIFKARKMAERKAKFSTNFVFQTILVLFLGILGPRSDLVAVIIRLEIPWYDKILAGG